MIIEVIIAWPKKSEVSNWPIAYCALWHWRHFFASHQDQGFSQKDWGRVDLDKKGIEGHFDLDAFVVLDHTASIHVAVILIASTPVLLILIALVLTLLFCKTWKVMPQYSRRAVIICTVWQQRQNLHFLANLYGINFRFLCHGVEKCQDCGGCRNTLAKTKKLDLISQSLFCRRRLW